MLTIPRHFLLTFAGLLAISLYPARADDADAVKEKLFQAKKEYDTELQKFKKAVTELLDKREEEARKTGKLKLVDQLKVEREAFEKSDGTPSMIPALVHESVIAARTKLDTAYKSAVKEYLRLKLDDAVESTEKERKEFLIAGAFLYGKRTYLAKLAPSDIRVWSKHEYEKDASKYKMNGEAIPHSLFMHPDSNGEASVSYTLVGNIVVFRGSIGIPRHVDPQHNPASPVTFEVVGDKKSLWKSEPVTKIDSFQNFTVCVEKVKVLTLRIHCQGQYNWSHCVWFGPILVE
jgi:hypothetical protein